MSRRLSDFIEGFQAYAEVYNTTPLFAKATAIWMVGTAVRRQVGMRARGNSMHPNLFMELVGGPGTGKSQAISAARSIFIPATDSSIIPASVTRAGMEDYMQQNLQQSMSPDGALLLSHECVGLSEEMQGILPDQDLGHLTLYNILYDLPKLHKARTRTHGEIALEAPYCSILTGAQPAFLATTMPEAAWGMGFMSRSIMVFDSPRERRSMFELRETDPTLKANLIYDLKTIKALYGWMEWTREAEGLYDEWWVQAGGIPIPAAKRLCMGYNSRREMHMAKLAMCLSLSRSDDLFVDERDVAAAIETLLNFESRMNSIFQEMAATGSMVMLQDVNDKIKADTAEGSPTEEAAIIQMLMQRFPATQVHSMINNLVDSRVIKNVSNVDVKGCRRFMAGDTVAVM
jgi:hypothetical protein